MLNMRNWPTKRVNSRNETLFSISFELEACQISHNIRGKLVAASLVSKCVMVR